LLLRVALAAAAATLATGPAAAHPHIWVTTKTSVLYENGAVTGLRHAWTFDQGYTEMAIEGLDKNNDGVYSREELAELAKVNIEALKEFGYFTFPKLAGTPLEMATPKDYYLEHKMIEPAPDANLAPAEPKPAGDGAAAAKLVPSLTLHFTLPLAKPVLAEADGLTFSMGDPSFFIAFEPAPDTPVVLGAGAPKHCRVEREEETPRDANPSQPGDTMATQPSDLSIDLVAAPVWKITCKAAG
jgi:ABC-type uncharacterized transport system substrate-binding protein